MSNSRRDGQLIDSQNNIIGLVRVSTEGNLWSGEIDLTGAASSVVALFTRFEVLVDMQVLSLIDEVEIEIARLGPRLLLAESGEVLPVADLQVYPAQRKVSFRVT